MAFEIPGFSFTLVAGVNLSTSLFRAVNVDANGKAVLPAVNGDIVGFLNNKPAINQAATIISTGIPQAEAGGVIAAGAKLGVDALGRVITWTVGPVVGRALEAASAAGIIIAVLATI